jgi:hypothetical protein
MKPSFFLLLIFSGLAAFGQTRQQETSMVPSLVYVGDRASLILPLPGFAFNNDAETVSGKINSTGDIDIHHAAIERRPGGSRLVIEFTAYTPGILELPPVSIAGEVFTGLKIDISSILEHDESGRVLSGPALPIAIPGTSLLVYGSICAIIFSLLFSLWVLFMGQKKIKVWLEAWKRWRLFASMRGTEKRLRRTLAKGTPCRDILNTLSVEFRSFLGVFTGEYCPAMTAAEFANIANGEFLKNFFYRCDGSRFSNRKIHSDDALAMLDDLKKILVVLEKEAP